MTIFDTETDGYLESLGECTSNGTWNDVVRRARATERQGRLVRITVATGTAAAATAGALAGVGIIGGPSIVEKAEAAVLRAIEPAEGTIEHVLVEYRDDSGHAFIVYETWIAADGSWCRRTVEGIPGDAVAATRLTECRSSDGLIELYLPSTNEILRTRPEVETRSSSEAVEVGSYGITVRFLDDGTLAIERDGNLLTSDEVNALPEEMHIAIKQAASEAGVAAAAELVDPGPAPDWLTEDIIEAFRKDAVHEAGTVVFEGREYTKLVTEDAGRVPGSNAVLVDPETGESVAWIPDPQAFGVPTIVVRTRETLPDDERNRRSLSLTALHPDATVLDLSPAELSEAIGAQYPNG